MANVMMHQEDQVEASNCLHRYLNADESINMEKYGLTVYTQLKEYPFFSRFNKEYLMSCMA